MDQTAATTGFRLGRLEPAGLGWTDGELGVSTEDVERSASRMPVICAWTRLVFIWIYLVLCCTGPFGSCRAAAVGASPGIGHAAPATHDEGTSLGASRRGRRALTLFASPFGNHYDFSREASRPEQVDEPHRQLDPAFDPSTANPQFQLFGFWEEVLPGSKAEGPLYVRSLILLPRASSSCRHLKSSRPCLSSLQIVRDRASGGANAGRPGLPLNATPQLLGVLEMDVREEEAFKNEYVLVVHSNLGAFSFPLEATHFPATPKVTSDNDGSVVIGKEVSPPSLFFIGPEGLAAYLAVEASHMADDASDQSGPSVVDSSHGTGETSCSDARKSEQGGDEAVDGSRTKAKQKRPLRAPRRAAGVRPVVAHLASNIDEGLEGPVVPSIEQSNPQRTDDGAQESLECLADMGDEGPDGLEKRDLTERLQRWIRLENLHLSETSYSLEILALGIDLNGMQSPADAQHCSVEDSCLSVHLPGDSEDPSSEPTAVVEATADGGSLADVGISVVAKASVEIPSGGSVVIGPLLIDMTTFQRTAGSMDQCLSEDSPQTEQALLIQRPAAVQIRRNSDGVVVAEVSLDVLAFLSNSAQQLSQTSDGYRDWEAESPRSSQPSSAAPLEAMGDPGLDPQTLSEQSSAQPSEPTPQQSPKFTSRMALELTGQHSSKPEDDSHQDGIDNDFFVDLPLWQWSIASAVLVNDFDRLSTNAHYQQVGSSVGSSRDVKKCSPKNNFFSLSSFWQQCSPAVRLYEEVQGKPISGAIILIRSGVVRDLGQRPSRASPWLPVDNPSGRMLWKVNGTAEVRNSNPGQLFIQGSVSVVHDGPSFHPEPQILNPLDGFGNPASDGGAGVIDAYSSPVMMTPLPQFFDLWLALVRSPDNSIELKAFADLQLVGPAGNRDRLREGSSAGASPGSDNQWSDGFFMDEIPLRAGSYLFGEPIVQTACSDRVSRSAGAHSGFNDSLVLAATALSVPSYGRSVPFVSTTLQVTINLWMEALDKMYRVPVEITLDGPFPQSYQRNRSRHVVHDLRSLYGIKWPSPFNVVPLPPGIGRHGFHGINSLGLPPRPDISKGGAKGDCHRQLGGGAIGAESSCGGLSRDGECKGGRKYCLQHKNHSFALSSGSYSFAAVVIGAGVLVAIVGGGWLLTKHLSSRQGRKLWKAVGIRCRKVHNFARSWCNVLQSWLAPAMEFARKLFREMQRRGGRLVRVVLHAVLFCLMAIFVPLQWMLAPLFRNEASGEDISAFRKRQPLAGLHVLDLSPTGLVQTASIADGQSSGRRGHALDRSRAARQRRTRPANKAAHCQKIDQGVSQTRSTGHSHGLFVLPRTTNNIWFGHVTCRLSRMAVRLLWWKLRPPLESVGRRFRAVASAWGGRRHLDPPLDAAWTAPAPSMQPCLPSDPQESPAVSNKVPPDSVARDVGSPGRKEGPIGLVVPGVPELENLQRDAPAASTAEQPERHVVAEALDLACADVHSMPLPESPEESTPQGPFRTPTMNPKIKSVIEMTEMELKELENILSAPPRKAKKKKKKQKIDEPSSASEPQDCSDKDLSSQTLSLAPMKEENRSTEPTGSNDPQPQQTQTAEVPAPLSGRDAVGNRKTSDVVTAQAHSKQVLEGGVPQTATKQKAVQMDPASIATGALSSGRPEEPEAKPCPQVLSMRALNSPADAAPERRVNSKDEKSTTAETSVSRPKPVCPPHITRSKYCLASSPRWSIDSKGDPFPAGSDSVSTVDASPEQCPSVPPPSSQEAIGVTPTGSGTCPHGVSTLSVKKTPEGGKAVSMEWQRRETNAAIPPKQRLLAESEWPSIPEATEVRSNAIGQKASNSRRPVISGSAEDEDAGPQVDSREKEIPCSSADNVVLKARASLLKASPAEVADAMATVRDGTTEPRVSSELPMQPRPPHSQCVSDAAEAWHAAPPTAKPSGGATVKSAGLYEAPPSFPPPPSPQKPREFSWDALRTAPTVLAANGRGNPIQRKLQHYASEGGAHGRPSLCSATERRDWRQAEGFQSYAHDAANRNRLGGAADLDCPFVEVKEAGGWVGWSQPSRCPALGSEQLVRDNFAGMDSLFDQFSHSALSGSVGAAWQANYHPAGYSLSNEMAFPWPAPPPLWSREEALSMGGVCHAMFPEPQLRPRSCQPSTASDGRADCQRRPGFDRPARKGTSGWDPLFPSLAAATAAESADGCRGKDKPSEVPGDFPLDDFVSQLDEAYGKDPATSNAAFSLLLGLSTDDAHAADC